MKEDNKEQPTLFADNGNLTPCPYRSWCSTFGIGCKGESYWCKRYDKEEEK